jgi:hypothetical protein
MFQTNAAIDQSHKMGYDGFYAVETPMAQIYLAKTRAPILQGYFGIFRNRDTALALGVHDTTCRSHGLIGSPVTQRHCKEPWSGSRSGKGRSVSSLLYSYFDDMGCSVISYLDLNGK